MTVLAACPSFGELTDYWTSDVSPGDIERIEEHAFGCERCARLLACAEDLRSGIGALARTGGFQAFVTDALLNQLARDGVRVRSYALGPGESVQCTVWSDDEVMVARLRADFTGVTSVDAVMQFEGEALSRATDVPVGQGTTELVLALPAAALRASPRTTMRLTLSASPESSRAGILAEYVFNHEGTLHREG